MNHQAGIRKGKPVKTSLTKRVFLLLVFRVLPSVILFTAIVSCAVIVLYYNKYSWIIDQKLNGKVFNNTAKIFAAPSKVYLGQKLITGEVIRRLQQAGFESDAESSSTEGAYTVKGNQITIWPPAGVPYRIEFHDGKVARIVKLAGGELSAATLPPTLVTHLFDETRTKRRLIEFQGIPKALFDAVIAGEDQRFYRHYGLDPVRILGSLIANFKHADRLQGGSTITQQLARDFFMTPDRTWSCKILQAFIALILEQRLPKEKIFTLYANEVYLGQRGSFSIHGFGEAAAAIFGKDLGALTLPEAATLAGIIPAPNAFSPSKHPDRAIRRRNQILKAMAGAGTITQDEYTSAKQAELKVVPLKPDVTDAPYLVDFIREELLKDYSQAELLNGNFKVYTTLDPELQQAAVEAVEKGLSYVAKQFTERDKQAVHPEKRPLPQAGLIAVDPHTGEIRAMVGGSNYASTQYNRITQAFRQPGSIFKPFVYAAAFETAYDDPLLANQGPPVEAVKPDPQPAAAAEVTAGLGNHSIQSLGEGCITPITTVMDEPTVFVYEDGRTYEPGNYKQKYHGLVTIRTVLQSSLNVPTIKVAEQIGYDRVAKLAMRMGLNAKIKGFPSVALGAFEVTPIELAGAYTVFANEGRHIQPHTLLRVDAPDGTQLKEYAYQAEEVLRPEIAYMLTNLMEGVIDRGTGANVRMRGFRLPAAGKTGTSRDGWFAGYTKDLLVISWVGFDDNSDLKLEGARSGLPIWTEFMTRAYQLYPVRNAGSMRFNPPPGIEIVSIDADSLMLAGPLCENKYEEAFVAGTAPLAQCPLHASTIADQEPAAHVQRQAFSGPAPVRGRN